MSEKKKKYMLKFVEVLNEEHEFSGSFIIESEKNLDNARLYGGIGFSNIERTIQLYDIKIGFYKKLERNLQGVYVPSDYRIINNTLLKSYELNINAAKVGIEAQKALFKALEVRKRKGPIMTDKQFEELPEHKLFKKLSDKENQIRDLANEKFSEAAHLAKTELNS